MDFTWSKMQLDLRARMKEFAERELNDDLEGRDARAEFPHENWKKCADFGILGSAIPEELGGLGSDALTTMLMMEGLGHGCRDNGLLFGLNAQMWSVQHPILVMGNDEQKQQYLPGLCDGSLIGAHGMTEPDSGSDVFNLRTRAERRDGGYVLNGTKTLVTNAPVCDLAVVFATTDADKGQWGISAFIVDKGTEGFSISKNMHKMGLRSSPIGELVLNDCFLPESQRLGPEGSGAGTFNSSMAWERSCIFGGHVGAMERLLDECLEYARERRQFKQPIGKFQPVSDRIADMKVRLETSRTLLYRTAWLTTQGKATPMDAAIAKLYISESYVQSSLDAIRLHGGYGYLTELGIERNLRDAMGGTLYSGTSDIQRLMIARWLGA